MKEIFIPSANMTFETVIEDKRRLNNFFEQLTKRYSSQLGFRLSAKERDEGVYTQYMTDDERVCNNAESPSAKSINWIFDLTQVTACDSAGVALLIEAKRLSQSHQYNCHFQGISSAIQMWIQFCGVEEVLFSSQEEMKGSLLC
jgi:phospholipid transport system transporter-binding protein